MLGKFTFTNKIVAKNLNIDEDRINRVTSFFIQELNRELMGAEHPFVYVRGLGTFTLCLKPIENRLRWYLVKRKEILEESKIRNCENNLLGLRRCMFELFHIRRVLKAKKKERKRIKDEHCAGKNKNDIGGQLLPTNR